MLFYEISCCNKQPVLYKGRIETNKERENNDKHTNIRNYKLFK